MQDNEQSGVTPGEIDTDIFADEGEITPVSDPPAEETNPTPDEQPEPSTDDEEPEAAPEEEPQGEPDGEEPAPEAAPRSAEARKEALNAEIRALVAQRNSLRDQTLERLNAQTEVKSAEELVEEGYDPTLARLEAFENERDAERENARIADLNTNINMESLQVMHDFPMFDPASPSYNKDVADMASSLYQKTAGMQVDEKSGLVTQTSVTPYQFYQYIDKIVGQSAQSGEVKGQKNAERMLASADTVPAAAPKAPKADPLLDLWDN